MALYSTKFFGEIELDNVEKYYEIDVELYDKTVELTIYISTASTSVDKESIIAIENYIENLEENEKDIRSLIWEDFKSGGEVKNYIDWQIDEQEKEEIDNLILTVDKKLNKREKLLSVIYLLRIGFYPEKEDKVFAVHDYTIDDDLTDELLVAILDKNNTVTITIES
jgi:hypothetical protein